MTGCESLVDEGLLYGLTLVLHTYIADEEVTVLLFFCVVVVVV